MYENKFRTQDHNYAFHVIQDNNTIRIHAGPEAPPWGETQGTFHTPPKLKKCCRKMMLFPKALFLATTFPKVAKNSIFLLKLYQKFSKFSQNLQSVFVLTRERLTHCLFNSLKTMLNNGFIAIFLRDFLKIFENVPKFPINLCFASRRAKN